MDSLWLELRYAARRLYGSKGYAAAAVLSLALGIGANLAVFTAVNRIFLEPLPIDRPSELVSLGTRVGNRPGGGVSYPNYVDFRKQATSFSELIAHEFRVANLGSGVSTERVLLTVVSDNYFSGLGVVMEQGRAPVPREEERVAVVSDALARRRGIDVGDRVLLDGNTLTIVGIADRGFTGLTIGLVTDVWVPIDGRHGILQSDLERREASLFMVVGYLNHGVTLEEASSEIGVVARQLEEAYPEANKNRRATIEPFTALWFPNATLAFGLVAAMTGLVLLIGCANVANFMLARAWSRRHETAIRLALGSGMARLVQQVLSESLLLSLASGVVALPMLRIGPLFVDLAQPSMPMPVRLDLSPDFRVFGFAFLLAVATSVVVGLAPVLRLRRNPAHSALHAVSSAAQGGRLMSFRFALAAGQIALCVVCVLVSVLFARSLSAQLATDLGYEPDGMFVASLDLPVGRYDDETGPAFARRLSARLKSMPGVVSASVSTHIPLWDDYDVGFGRIWTEGPQPDDVSRVSEAVKAFVGSDYFETLQLPVTRGRGIGEGDGRGSAPVAVISEPLATALFPNEDPLGRHLVFQGVQFVAFHNSGTERVVYRVVGVAADAKHFSVRQGRLHIIYVPLSQEFSPSLSVLVRTQKSAGLTARSVVKEIETLDAELPISNVKELSDIVLQSLFFLRAGTALLGLLGWMAALLAGIGIYSVVAYFVSQRTHEVGLRMALGARTRDIVTLLLRGATVYGLVGMTVGFAVSFGLGGILGSLLAGVSATDPMAYGAAGLLVPVVVGGAALVPAFRASRLTPSVALRHE